MSLCSHFPNSYWLLTLYLSQHRNQIQRHILINPRQRCHKITCEESEPNPWSKLSSLYSKQRDRAMHTCKLWRITSLIFLVVTKMVVGTDQTHIPTTLEGPFKPATRRFDPSLRRGSDDLPMDHPRLKKNVTLNFPEQIALAISSPTSMWVSWVTGTY